MLDKKKILTLLEKAPKLRDESHPPGLSDSELRRLEQGLNLELPDDFREFLKISNGPCGICGIRTSDPLPDIEATLRLHPQWLKKPWLPLACDDCGNYYVVALRDELGPGKPVMFIDHEESYDVPCYIVASDVGHFLEFFLESEIVHEKLRPEFVSEYKQHGHEGRLIFPVDDPRLPQWPFNKAYVVARDPAILTFSKNLLPWEVDKKGRGE